MHASIPQPVLYIALRVDYPLCGLSGQLLSVDMSTCATRRTVDFEVAELAQFSLLSDSRLLSTVGLAQLITVYQSVHGLRAVDPSILCVLVPLPVLTARLPYRSLLQVARVHGILLPRNVCRLAYVYYSLTSPLPLTSVDRCIVRPHGEERQAVRHR